MDSFIPHAHSVSALNDFVFLHVCIKQTVQLCILLFLYDMRLCLITVLLLAATCAMTDQQLILNVTKTLQSHLLEGTKWGLPYHFYRPGLVKYGPDQWLWDSSFHMIAWSRLNVTNSILDLRTMLQMQKDTGEVPQMIFWGKQGRKDKILNNLMNSDPKTTDISQMPMLAFALRRIWQATHNKSLLKEFLPKVTEYYTWWARDRQPDRDGLIVIIHPWQSGLDASPMYDEALGVKNPQPKLMELYPNFQKIVLSYRFLYNWDQSKIIKKKNRPINEKWPTYFVVKQVGINAVYTYSWKILSQLAAAYGNQPLSYYCQEQYKYFSRGVLKLYDSSKNKFVSQYLSGKVYKNTRADTVQSLFPLLLDLPEYMKNQILAALEDPKKYCSDYPIPTVAQDDPAFNPVFTIDLMWRGPSWAAPNYFVLEALRRHNETELYKKIGTKWVNHVKNFGLWQMWNPLNGTGYGVPGLGMTSSVVDVLYRLKQMTALQS